MGIRRDRGLCNITTTTNTSTSTSTSTSTTTTTPRRESVEIGLL